MFALVTHVTDSGDTEPYLLQPQFPAIPAPDPELGEGAGDGETTGVGEMTGVGEGAGVPAAGAIATDTAIIFPVAALYVTVAGLNAPADVCACCIEISLGA